MLLQAIMPTGQDNSMKPTTRYGLIIFGFCLFIILAPLLILYVTGTRFNFNSDSNTTGTGIFDAKSNPTNATLYIDDKEHSNTPAIARFLNQGEYVFTLKKEGYYDWSKRLPIESGNVNYAQVGVAEIEMIKKSEPLVIETAGVQSFVLVGNTIWYAQGNNVVYTPANDPADKTVVTNVGTTPITLTQLRNKKFLLATDGTQSTVINTDAKSFALLPFKVSDISQLQMISDDTMVYVMNNTLFSYNIIAKNTVALSQPGSVFAMTAINTTGYFAKADGTVTSAVWSGAQFTDEQTLVSGITVASTGAQLFISDRKELFIKNGAAGLFRVGQQLDTVIEQAESVRLDAITNELTFISSGELWFYNFITNRPQLLTRNTANTHAFLIRSSIGFGFLATDAGLEAVEIDTRDKQNRYQLLSEKPVWQVMMTENQKTIIALQDGSLVLLEVRN